MTALATPDRSLDQRLGALRHANGIRSKRAEFKRDLKAGRASLPLTLVDPPEWLESAKVFDILLAAPKIGRVKANKILALCRVSPSKTVGGISSRQRSELVAQVGRHCGRRTSEPASGPTRQDGNQHMLALNVANKIRLERSQLKVDVATGVTKIADVLAAPPCEARTMAIADLIGSQNRWGINRARRMLSRLGIPEMKPVEALTKRQVGAIVDHLEGRAPVVSAPRPARAPVQPAGTPGRVFKAPGGVLHIVPGDDSYTTCGHAFWDMLDGKAADWHGRQPDRCIRCWLAVDRRELVVKDA